MPIRLLGPVSVRDADGRELLPAGARVRGLLARLALDAGRPVDAPTLVDALWGTDPPSTANALQSLVSRLRRALGAPRLRSSAGGYVLEADPDEVDALRFAALRRDAVAAPDDERARALLGEALGLWHDPVLGGVRELPFADAVAARLAEARAAAAEELAARGLAGGVPDAGREVLSAVLDEHPLRETTAVALARGLHAGGRRADALGVLDRTRAALADELGVDPGPELRRARTELLHDAASPPAPRRAGTEPPHDAAPPPAPSLPPATVRRAPALTSFVGRGDDLARVRALLGTSRLVTVTGPGGAGKTRLALEAVRGTTAPAEDGALLRSGGGDVASLTFAVVELAALTGADQVAPAVLHAVGGPELALGEPTAPDTLARLRGALDGRELVLLLDNCEHLVDAAAELVHELLRTVEGLVVLATSREPLGVPGEMLHPLGALDDRHAARLFVERAAAVRPGFSIDDDDVVVVREICRRLDGQPLPIELAAARVRSLEPAEIAERLADRFRLLTTGARTALPRHQTLRAVVDWSWDLLSPAERRIAARFGVFAGAVDARTVEAVCGDDTFDLLGALVDKSLVVAVPDSGGPTRYRMLETIREYAAARLAGSGERDAVVDAHTERVLAVLEAGEPRLRSAAQLDELAVVRRIEGEAVRALERAVGDDDAGRAHRLLAALTWSWVIRGDMATLTRWSDRVAQLPTPAPATAVAVNRSMRAVLLVARPDTSSPLAETAAVAAMLPALPLPWHPVVALHGPVARAYTENDRSELEALADGDGDPWLRAAAAEVASIHAENAGEVEVQRRYLRAAHEGFSRLGDRFGLGMTTFALGELEDLAGDRAAARRAVAEAIALGEELRNVDDLPQYRMALASLAARDGDAAEAYAQLALADEVAAGVSEPWTAAWLTQGRADVERRLGNPAEALSLLAGLPAGFVADAGLGQDQREASVHTIAAAALVDLGRHAEARERLDLAERAAEKSEDGPVLGRVAETAARAALAVGDAERAAELLGAAVTRRGALHLGDPEVVALRARVRFRGR